MKDVKNISMEKSEKYFQCQKCMKSLQSLRSLLRHKLTHESLSVQQEKKNSQRQKCPDCEKSFANKSCVLRHIHRIHNPIPIHKFKCHSCEVGFLRKDNLYKHLRNIHDQNVKPMNSNLKNCKFCDSNFAGKNDLWSHERLTHGFFRNSMNENIRLIGIIPKLKKCKNAQIKSKKINKPMQDRKENFTTEVAELKQKLIWALNIHKFMMNEKNNIVQEDTTAPILEDPIDLNDINRKFPCDMCDSTFYGMFQLETHIKKIHLKDPDDQTEQNHDEIDIAFDQEKMDKLTQLINELRADNIL